MDALSELCLDRDLLARKQHALSVWNLFKFGIGCGDCDAQGTQEREGGEGHEEGLYRWGSVCLPHTLLRVPISSDLEVARWVISVARLDRLRDPVLGTVEHPSSIVCLV